MDTIKAALGDLLDEKPTTLEEQEFLDAQTKIGLKINEWLGLNPRADSETLDNYTRRCMYAGYVESEKGAVLKAIQLTKRFFNDLVKRTNQVLDEEAEAIEEASKEPG